ncbi:MAG TPA: 4-(cytidine 5'-diphospho)-2-C-methyl-D-erythritol kinase [Ktedonobacterales bacterium]|nr:4-(cytidine 5'-diphospho)-2-C-methyl-D-erythritol kinase [Ktedonobacterales bacterium]
MLLPHAALFTAYAKINLTLEVLGRRTDGYHELASVMQTVALHDTIMLHTAPEGALSLTCDVPELEGDQNLALCAARALASASGTPANLAAKLELRKETPTQAGLGGGSSDAACTLVALDQWWGLHLNADQLSTIAAGLGSDVPFFLRGGAAEVRGRGERVIALPDAEPIWVVLVKPPVNVPTPAAYRALRAADFSDGAATARVAEAIRRTRMVPLACLVNSFEASVLRDYPAVARTWETLAAAGAPVVRLSGSGPTLFAPFETLAPAAAVFTRMRDKGHAAWLTHTVSRTECEGAMQRVVR